MAVKADTPASPAIRIKAVLKTNVEIAVANDETPSDEPLYKRAPVNFALNFPFVKFKIDDFLKNGIATIKKDAVNDSPVAIGAPMIPKFKTLIKT